jgi:hypothetical protein
MPTLDFHLDDRSPFERTFRLSKGATLPKLELRLLDGATAANITGAAVTFSMDDEAGVAKVTDQAGAIVVPATDGKFEYAWAAADVDTEGRFFGQFKLVIGGVQHLVPNNSAQKLRIEIGPAV